MFLGSPLLNLAPNFLVFIFFLSIFLSFFACFAFAFKETIWVVFGKMKGENLPLVTDNPIEFE